MRKLFWGGAVTCLLAAGLGFYHAQVMRRAELAPTASTAEEQSAPPCAFVGPPPVLRLPSFAHPEEGVEVVEPIVVDAPPLEPAAVPEIGGAPEFGGSPAARDWNAPRPDTEPGRARAMPYAEDTDADGRPAMRLWQALCRILAEPDPEPATPEPTPEPPLGGPAQAPKPEATLQFPPPPHDHLQASCCPFTGRCPLPYHPAAPRGDLVK